MRTTNILATTFLLLPSISALQIPPPIFADFYEPEGISNDTSSTSANENASGHELRRRDGNCPVDFNSCSTLDADYGGACCTSGSTCTMDHAKNIACCPLGAVCTGTITAGSATATTGAVGGGGGVVIGGSTTATTSGAVATSPTTATGTSAATITASPSLVPNAYFPFPIIASSYENSAACVQAYSACQSNYALCQTYLQGGQAGSYGVTVNAPQGGVTVPATAQNLGAAQATSVCGGLSASACHGLQASDCGQYGTATGGGSFLVGEGTANGGQGMRARATMGCLGMMAGVGWGVMGGMV
ncbi:hypothetical protein BJ875DRAFT_515212 [Amylocarpus encephaloides]|uniref:Uncharacterized protein n=1 Tax=Amylocarpus encephaloides TaxID=45428 RepID=A0A9P8C367_9HELO|nr:hypothetical protein BJ875DRAFT_515212 [Amylocarpus encephaloides]